MHGQRSDSNRVEPNRGTERQGVGRLVIKQDATGVSASRVRQHAHGCFQAVCQVEVGRSGAIDAAQRGQPGQGSFWLPGFCPFTQPRFIMKGGGKCSQGSAGREGCRGVAIMPTSAVKEVLQASDSSGHRFFQAQSSASGLRAKRGEEIAQWLRSNSVGCMNRIRRPQVSYQLIAKVMDRCGFHDDASTQKRPPDGMPGGHGWCNDAGSV